MRRQLRDGLISVGAVMILLLILIAMDDHVRDQVSLRVVSHPAAGLASAGREVRDFTTVISEAARYQSIGHAPLLIFALAAGVLMLFMLRT